MQNSLERPSALDSHAFEAFDLNPKRSFNTMCINMGRNERASRERG